MYLSTSCIFSLTVFVHLTVAQSAANAPCVFQYQHPKLRYPPPSLHTPPNGNYHGMKFGKWTLPQPQNLYGTYITTHSSCKPYMSLVNMRVDRYPVFPQSDDFPSGSYYRVLSWSACADPYANCSDPYATKTMFGFLKPIGALGPTDKRPAAAWKHHSTGLWTNATALDAILGFGIGTNGADYMVHFETMQEAEAMDSQPSRLCLSIESRREDAPSEQTMNEILSGLKEIGITLEDKDFTQVVDKVVPLKHDGRRTYEGPIFCDDSCTRNEVLLVL